jgi:hypothetical protein
MPGPRSRFSLGMALTKRTAREDRHMPGPAELPAQQPAPIIGRGAGLARLCALADPVPSSSQVMVVTGEAGMGKTVLLAAAADQARSAGMRVLSVTGRESESRLAFAGLHQLLRPVLSGAVGLPGRQAQALSGALGLAADPGAPDPLLTGAAVLTLLSDLSEHSPVLVVADDAHWLDRSSLDALAFAASRLDAEPVVLLVGARGQAPPPGFDRGFPELRLEPLSAADAGLLLDGQPRPPRGQARLQVVAQAAGNPMALIELATVIADDPAASRRWAAQPLPLTDRLSAVITARFAALPEQTRAALLLAAGSSAITVASSISAIGLPAAWATTCSLACPRGGRGWPSRSRPASAADSGSSRSSEKPRSKPGGGACPRAPTSSTIRSASRRLPTNASTSSEPRSIHCASSATTRTGERSERSESRVRTATLVRSGS